MNSSLEDTLRRILKNAIVEAIQEAFPYQFQPKCQVWDREGQSGKKSPFRLLLRPREAAEALAISERHLWELTQAGELPCVRVNRLVRYDIAKLREWILVPHSVPARSAKPDNGPQDTPRTREKKGRRPQTATARTPPTPPARPLSSKPDPVAENRVPKRPTIEAALRKSITDQVASRLGIDPARFPRMTNGGLMRIAGVDIPTLHGWQYLGREIPEAAMQKFETHFAQYSQDRD